MVRSQGPDARRVEEGETLGRTRGRGRLASELSPGRARGRDGGVGDVKLNVGR